MQALISINGPTATINGVEYIRRDLAERPISENRVVDYSDENISMTELSKIWKRDKTTTKEAVLWMRANDIQIGYQDGKPWKISRRKAMEYIGDGTTERAFSAVREHRERRKR